MQLAFPLKSGRKNTCFASRCNVVERNIQTICYDIVFIRAVTLNEKLMHLALIGSTNAVKIALTLEDSSLHCLLIFLVFIIIEIKSE